MKRGASRLRNWALAIGLVLPVMFVAGVAASQSGRSAPLLLGGDAPSAERLVAIDVRLPRGERRSSSFFGAESEGQESIFSSRFPVSVSGARGASRRRALELLERAYERAWLTHGAAPRLGSLHWRAQESANQGEALPAVHAQRVPSLGFDRATVVCAGGRLSEDSAETCVLEGLVLGAAPATARTLLRGFSVLARAQDALASTPRELTSEILRDHPARPILTRDPSLNVPGASALFFAAFADRAGKSSSDPGFFALTLAATKSEGGAFRWNAEPDVLDVVRTSLGSDREAYARLLDRLGAARFAPLPGLSAIATLQGGPAKPAWTIPIDTLPRNLTLQEPIYPTGSVAFEIVGDAAVDSPLAFRIDCESPVTYAWSVVRLSAEGEFLGHFPVPYKESSPRSDQRIEPHGAHRLLLVGTNLGGVDLDHPYDPDHSPHEPHGCSVYIAHSP